MRDASQHQACAAPVYLRLASLPGHYAIVQDHLPYLAQETYGKQDARRWWVRWRVFYLGEAMRHVL